jgi:hypothetical protein
MSMDAPLPHAGRSASGIVSSGLIHCLHLLAEDAARLGLPRTHLAICQVLEICEAERVARATLAPSGHGQGPAGP